MMMGNIVKASTWREFISWIGIDWNLFRIGKGIHILLVLKIGSSSNTRLTV